MTLQLPSSRPCKLSCNLTHSPQESMPPYQRMRSSPATNVASAGLRRTPPPAPCASAKDARPSSMMLACRLSVCRRSAPPQPTTTQTAGSAQGACPSTLTGRTLPIAPTGCANAIVIAMIVSHPAAILPPRVVEPQPAGALLNIQLAPLHSTTHRVIMTLQEETGTDPLLANM